MEAAGVDNHESRLKSCLAVCPDNCKIRLGAHGCMPEAWTPMLNSTNRAEAASVYARRGYRTTP